MLKSKWERHYSGIEIAECELAGINLYRQRDRETKRLQFIRFSVRRHMIGAFIGQTNYIKGGSGGFEFFSRAHHIGWSSKRSANARFFRIDWSGSMRDPYQSFTLRFGRFGIGGRAPKWLRRMREYPNP